MAYCTKCSGEMNVAEVVCPHCGYDFPPPPPERGIEDSRFADVALVFGAFAAGLLCLVSLGQTLLAALHLFVELGSGELWNAIWHLGGGLLVAVLQFLLYFAVMVVFVRVRRIPV